MAKKIRKNYSIDSSTISKFHEICNNKGQEYSATVEQLMEWYIAQDAQIMMDDLYAPTIGRTVKREVEKLADRIFGTLYKLQVDSKANMYLQAALHKNTLTGVENIFDNALVEEILDPNRESLSEDWKVSQEGLQMIQNATNISHRQLKKERQEEMQAKKAQ